MYLWEIKNEIVRKIEEKYGKMGYEDIFYYCYLELTQKEYNFEEKTKIAEDLIEIEKNGIKARAKASVYRTINNNIVVYVDLLDLEIEPANVQIAITREI